MKLGSLNCGLIQVDVSSRQETSECGWHIVLAMLTHQDARRINVMTTRSQENRERVENRRWRECHAFFLSRNIKNSEALLTTHDDGQ